MLESTSLSEYIIDNGGPVVAGKQKDLAHKPRVVVESITKRLLADKLKYQDLPMLAILAVHFLVLLSAGKNADQTVALAYIGVTLMSLMSGYTSYRWPRLNKEVDLKTVVTLVQDRLQEADKRREEAKGYPDGKGAGSLAKDRSGLNSARGESSEDPDRSNQHSRGLNDVVQELEQLGKGKSANQPPGLDDT